MKIRMKISYSACLLERTLNEHILLAILKTYDERGKSGLIKDFESCDDHPRLISELEGQSVTEYTRLRKEKALSRTSGVLAEAEMQERAVIQKARENKYLKKIMKKAVDKVEVVDEMFWAGADESATD